MKVLCLLALVVAASAAGVERSQHKAAIVQRVQASQFGATVLAELQNRMHAGDPISALRDFIGRIRNRIEENGKNATAEQDAQEAQCVQDLVEIDDKIGQSYKVMEEEHRIIRTKTGEIDQLEAAIAAKEEQIRKTTDAIRLNKEHIATGDTLREQNEAIYQKAEADAQAVSAAVNEILAIESGSSLHTNQDETANMEDRDIQRGAVADVKAQALIQLQSASKKVKDETAKSFIQLAALSAEMFGQDKGDIDELRDLLQQLLTEIENYVKALAKENEQSIADWTALRATMVTEIEMWEADIQTFQVELQDLKTQRQAALDEKARAVSAWQGAKQELEAQYQTKDDLLKACSDSKDNYLIEMESRKEELETLDLIYEIIKDKLTSAGDRIAANVDQLMTGGQTSAAKGCYCDHACGVFNDCCPGCNTFTGANQHGSTKGDDVIEPVPWRDESGQVIAEPDYEGGEAERPSRDARAVYAQYSGTRENGFHF
jgi:biotin-(acetyl-CoA carboxylase) ligase